eukprot:6367657-Pyramimonas_sp.AAC.1
MRGWAPGLDGDGNSTGYRDLPAKALFWKTLWLYRCEGFSGGGREVKSLLQQPPSTRSFRGGAADVLRKAGGD